ncbi:aspartate kinase [Sporanaerobium hydrogeniformans]|uniref:Aspartate kinase n=1 Tax=Sporanaerobium hydrogeniformans TaxID=3072179 RepID=A0AC61DD19_9FIRM|nr:aspartate kinase [Sporanaerobium hydrogeniformans]PHV70643.1 aspartate kinase [Sporanaerobium hydrogeniformans]
MDIIIQKFGGTSVATEESREAVFHKIAQAQAKGLSSVVVVSAIGRKGSPYATDTLIDFVSQTAGSMADADYDLLLSCGEIISAVTMATLLRQRGFKAKALTGGQAGILTDSYHKNAELLYTHTDRLLGYLESGVIPVVAGFQGITESGEITTLGRGGSDTTAAILGAALKAKCIEIYTDVNGIMTADPRVYAQAKIIPSISYTEVFQMADSGAKVIHPRAVEYARSANIPLVIKNTFSEEPGTFIVQQVKEKAEGKAAILTSVAHKMNRVQFTIQDEVLSKRELLQEIASHNISIDLINIFPQHKIFTVDKEDQNQLEALLTQGGYSYTFIVGCAKVTAIGERMTGVPGVMARMMKALAKENIEILQTADSLTTISCLIKEEKVKDAVTLLHEEFGL